MEVLRDARANLSSTASGSETDDTALVDLESVYRAHAGFVWRNARRLIGDPVATDDVVHEVFLVVARRLHEYRQQAHIRSWLFAITYHVVQHLRRSRARYAKHLGEYAHCVEAGSSHGVSETDAASYQLRQLLLQLSESKRLVFIMAELEGMTSAEIGHCLGMKTGTVDSRLRAARQDLQSLLDRESARSRRYSR